ncbi:conserved hypothetical protein [Neospora caninum Liverpool]|uniref:Uncharacterized protein n=1 Tax=Neospora caninum (strain Liverpool) TaxID=572307 RepID=F0VP60_NEOCL|nr:conserved hypothetical protein [Neospora caninum Liverpool]CBZ55506.1 conserved hypothetical protein [Neospora caninum Liverpool]CEL70244.1 TPA: hypothetical protein BN1204_059310 [Neospora caninum Liverpool]|eukprot:XP_003885534.1 conserved hypothetical protein [Neospora caninum Liverpool]
MARQGGRAKAKAASAAKKKKDEEREERKEDRECRKEEASAAAAEATQANEKGAEAERETKSQAEPEEAVAGGKTAERGQETTETSGAAERRKNASEKDAVEKETLETVSEGGSAGDASNPSPAESEKKREEPKDDAASVSAAPGASQGVRTPDETGTAAGEEASPQENPSKDAESHSQEGKARGEQTPASRSQKFPKGPRKEARPPRVPSAPPRPPAARTPPPPPGAPLILSAPQRLPPHVPPPPSLAHCHRYAPPPPHPSFSAAPAVHSPRPRFPPSPFSVAPAFPAVSPVPASPPFQQRTLEGAMDPFAQLAYFTLLKQEREETAKFAASGEVQPASEEGKANQDGAPPRSDAASVVGAPSTVEVGSTYTGLSTTSHFGLYSEPEMLRRIEAARDYDEVRRLVTMYTEKAKKFPAVLGGLLLRLALLGRQAFKDQLLEMGRALLMKNAGVLEKDAAKRAMKEPPPGRTLAPLDPTCQEDVKFDDFTKTVARLSDLLVAQLQEQASRVSNDVLQNLLWALSLTQANCMLVFRRLAGYVLARQDFSVSQLVTVFCAYTRGLEKTADRKGGINITSDDNAFFEDCVQKLLKRPDELPSLSTKQIALFLQACNRLNYNNAQLLKHVGKLSLQKEKEFLPKEWASVVAVFTRFGVPLRGECEKLRRERRVRDWERPPPPKKPKPISQC